MGPNKQKWHCAEERYGRRENRMGETIHIWKKKNLIPDYGAADNYVSGLEDKYFFQDLLMDHGCAYIYGDSQITVHDGF